MLRQSQAWDSFQNFMRSLKGSSDLRDFFVVCLSCCGFQNSAPFVFELLSAALIYTSLATRIQAVDEPANNRTQQPLAGCWARTFWHNEAYGKGWSEDYHGSGDCNHLAYDACINRYVFRLASQQIRHVPVVAGQVCLQQRDRRAAPATGRVRQELHRAEYSWRLHQMVRDLCIEEICKIPWYGGQRLLGKRLGKAQFLCAFPRTHSSLTGGAFH